MNNLYQLFKLQCLDLLVLEEMEYNGIIFDTQAARTKAKELEEELGNVREEVALTLERLWSKKH